MSHRRSMRALLAQMCTCVGISMAWQIGKITDIITKSTPRLFVHFNYRVVWADGGKGPTKLSVENYGHGSATRYNSWVLLHRA